MSASEEITATTMCPTKVSPSGEQFEYDAWFSRVTDKKLFTEERLEEVRRELKAMNFKGEIRMISYSETICIKGPLIIAHSREGALMFWRRITRVLEKHYKTGIGISHSPKVQPYRAAA